MRAPPVTSWTNPDLCSRIPPAGSSRGWDYLPLPPCWASCLLPVSLMHLLFPILGALRQPFVRVTLPLHLQKTWPKAFCFRGVENKNHLCFGSNKNHMNLRVEEEVSPPYGGLWFQTGWQITPCDTGCCPSNTGLSTLPGKIRSKNEENPGWGVVRVTIEVKT